MLARGPNGEEPSYVPKIRFWIEDERKLRTLTPKEWLAEHPKYFTWVDLD
jgi:hypothetical protein